jgi:hypothetical protein
MGSFPEKPAKTGSLLVKWQFKTLTGIKKG